MKPSGPALPLPLAMAWTQVPQLEDSRKGSHQSSEVGPGCPPSRMPT